MDYSELLRKSLDGVSTAKEELELKRWMKLDAGQGQEFDLLRAMRCNPLDEPEEMSDEEYLAVKGKFEIRLSESMEKERRERRVQQSGILFLVLNILLLAIQIIMMQ